MPWNRRRFEERKAHQDATKDERQRRERERRQHQLAHEREQASDDYARSIMAENDEERASDPELREQASEENARATMAENDEARIRDEVATQERLNARFPKFKTNGQPVHKGCQWCHTMYEGPHKDKKMRTAPSERPGEPEKPLEIAADSERMYTRDELREVVEREGGDSSDANLNRIHNIGGSVCPDCYKDMAASYRANYSQAEIDAAKEAARQEGEKHGSGSGEGA